MEKTTKTQTMKAGTATGSLINHIYGSNSTEPKVGEGATILSWTDRHAYEVMSVSEDGLTVIIQQYLPKRTDNRHESEMQKYEYKELNGYDEKIVWKRGAWRREIVSINWVDSYYKELDKKCFHPQEFWENTKELFDENHNMILVPGKTRIKKTYSKINIIFGVKKEYYDYSF